MDEKTENDNIEKLKTYLKKQRKIFNQQLKEVEVKYPLVAFAFHLQEATIMELSLSKTIQSTSAGSLISSINDKWVQTEDITSRVVREIESKWQKCKRNFIRDVIEAGNDGDSLVNAGRTHSECLRGGFRPR